MKACDRLKAEMSLLEWMFLQYLHPKARKSSLKLPHKNFKVCLHKEGLSNIESFGTTFIFYEKSSAWVSPERQLAPANSFSISRKAGKGLLTKITFIKILDLLGFTGLDQNSYKEILKVLQFCQDKSLLRIIYSGIKMFLCGTSILIIPL